MKAIISLVLTIIILSLSSCKPITMEQKEDKLQIAQAGKDNNVYVVKYDQVKDLDFSTGQVKGQLKENIYIDATVPTDIPDKMGDYEIYLKDLEESVTEEVLTDKMASLLDEYYGDDVSVTSAQLGGNERGTVYYEGNSGWFELDFLDSTYIYRMCKINDNFPEYGFDYDKEMIDRVVNDFLEVMEPIVPDGMDNDYVCIHISKEYKDYINEKYGEDSPFEWEWTEKYLEEEYLLDEYYLVRLYTEVEGVRLKTYNNPITYDLLDGEEVDTAVFVDEAVQGYKPKIKAYRHYWDLCIDENGKILGFILSDFYNVGEKMVENSIITAKEAVELFYNNIAKQILTKNYTISYVNLNYMVVVDDADENGYRNAYITPVWEIQMYEEGSSYYHTEIYSAVDGTRLKQCYLEYN